MVDLKSVRIVPLDTGADGIQYAVMQTATGCYFSEDGVFTPVDGVDEIYTASTVGDAIAFAVEAGYIVGSGLSLNVRPSVREEMGMLVEENRLEGPFYNVTGTLRTRHQMLVGNTLTFTVPADVTDVRLLLMPDVGWVLAEEVTLGDVARMETGRAWKSNISWPENEIIFDVALPA